MEINNKLDQEIAVEQEEVARVEKKTSEINKACEKHYQLEQELAFHKIDSKFDSLERGPEQSYDDTGEESDLLGESPYIGRAGYKANRLTGETSIPGASPSLAQHHSIPSPQRAAVKMEINKKLDQEIAVRQEKVAIAEDRLKQLTNELLITENDLKNATKNFKTIAEKEMQKSNIRQKMTRQIIRTVNEMMDQLSRMDNKNPNHRRVYADMVDKEQQINESNRMYGQLQEELALMVDRIAKETNDIKILEQQLNEDTLENNESLREELDVMVIGIQTYLAQVQTKADKKEMEFDLLLQEKEKIADRCRKLENELSVVDQEANSLRDLEKRYVDMEQTLRQQESRNRELKDQIHRSQRQDTHNQNILENKELDNASLKQALKDLEQKAQMEKQTLEKQLQTEKAKAIEGDRKSKEAQKKDEEVRRLKFQLETLKAQNVALKDRVEQYKHVLQIKESIPNAELKRKLNELSTAFEQNEQW